MNFPDCGEKENPSLEITTKESIPDLDDKSILELIGEELYNKVKSRGDILTSDEGKNAILSLNYQTQLNSIQNKMNDMDSDNNSNNKGEEYDKLFQNKLEIKDRVEKALYQTMKGIKNNTNQEFGQIVMEILNYGKKNIV